MEDKQLKQALQPSSECLSIEQLGRYRDEALAPAERTHADAHIRTCANCQAELALLDEFTALTVRDAEAAAVRDAVDALDRRRAAVLRETHRFGSKAPRRWTIAALRPAFALAALLLMFVGGYYLTQPASRNSSGMGPDVTRTSGVIALTPAGDVPAAPDRLEWQPVARASGYRVHITEVDRTELWSSDVTTASVTLPPSMRAQIVPGKTLVWQVTAYDAAGEPIAESMPQRFRVAR